jgi:3-methyladenine DNA glycosylase AlkD
MAPAANRPLIDALRAALAGHADAAQAGPMQAYMKSALPFHGVPAPLRRRLQAEAVKAHPCADTATLAATMRVLWREATHREERYAAVELARIGRHARLLDASLLPVYETMIVEGAWWDLCDDISGTALPALLQQDPALMKPLLRRWATGPQLWLRRAAMLAQRRLKHEVDAVLLYDCILPSIGEGAFADEFFIRKGIGWALRERSYQAPDEVRAFCAEYAHALSPLTVREALKALRRRGLAAQSS